MPATHTCTHAHAHAHTCTRTHTHTHTHTRTRYYRVECTSRINIMSKHTCYKIHSVTMTIYIPELLRCALVNLDFATLLSFWLSTNGS